MFALYYHEVETSLHELKGVVNHLDDIVVSGSTRKELLENLIKVFENCQFSNLRLGIWDIIKNWISEGPVKKSQPFLLVRDHPNFQR